MVRPMVHSTKHYVQSSLSTVVGGAVLNIVFATAVPVADKNLVSEIEEGNSIKAIYIEEWIRAGETTAGSGQLIVYKLQAGGAFPTATNMAALNDWANKKNIFYTTMGLYNDQDADAIAGLRQWLKVPKSKQRFGLGDILAMTIFTPTIDLHVCGFATYKEYS